MVIVIMDNELLVGILKMNAAIWVAAYKEAITMEINNLVVVETKDIN